MTVSPIELKKLHQLVLDITNIKRNHRIPNTDRSENVVEHSFSVAILAWRLFDELKPNLSLEKIFKYSLAHDFLERGLDQDVSSYANNQDRADKARYEQNVLNELSDEFSSFPDMLSVINDYENLVDEEARFVRTVDKMQAIILGEMDDWRPYRNIGVTHAEFTTKGDEYMEACPECLKTTLGNLNEHSRAEFYDQPV